MTTPPDAHVEPSAAATSEARRRFVTLTGLFLAGPSIFMVHFLAVYLLAEAVCAAGVDAELLGLPVLSSVTLLATVVAVAAAAVATLLACRRWRSTGVGWEGSDREASSGPGGGREHDAELALAGFLLGLLSIATILFVGLPALALEPCLP